MVKKSAIIKIIAVEQPWQASSNTHNQDLRRLYRRGGGYKFSNSSLSLHLIFVYCATFYHSALRHEQQKDVIYCRADQYCDILTSKINSMSFLSSLTSLVKF